MNKNIVFRAMAVCASIALFVAAVAFILADEIPFVCVWLGAGMSAFLTFNALLLLTGKMGKIYWGETALLFAALVVFGLASLVILALVVAIVGDEAPVTARSNYLRVEGRTAF